MTTINYGEQALIDLIAIKNKNLIYIVDLNSQSGLLPVKEYFQMFYPKVFLIKVNLQQQISY